MSSVCRLVSHCITGPDEHKHNLRKPNHLYITYNTSFRHNYRHFFIFSTLSKPCVFKWVLIVLTFSSCKHTPGYTCADISLMQACNRLYLCWHVLHASIQQAVPLLTFPHASIQQAIPVLTCPSCKHTTGYTGCPIPNYKKRHQKSERTSRH